ncbi:hypothetical protein [Calothrix sp. UHCC 0171]|nr:hypothetical protein [Calothrix sp. UHCC 0171]MEA5569837.1 hypothetical protein [Calothrix sp. UHCC 0171]
MSIEIYTQPDNSGEESIYKQRQDYDLSMQIDVVIENHKFGSLNVRDLLP